MALFCLYFRKKLYLTHGLVLFLKKALNNVRKAQTKNRTRAVLLSSTRRIKIRFVKTCKTLIRLTDTLVSKFFYKKRSRSIAKKLKNVC